MILKKATTIYLKIRIASQCSIMLNLCFDQATQNWHLLKVLPLLFGLIGSWIIVINLLNTVCAQAVIADQIVYWNTSSPEWSCFHSIPLNQSTIICHYPELILQLGPLIHLLTPKNPPPALQISQALIAPE